METKYPRTPHLIWSESVSKDDRIIQPNQLSKLKSAPVIVTEKMDGENTTLYRHTLHARSLQNRPHESRDWLKQMWSKINFSIPENMRICGENLYAKHSIYYTRLPSYFLVFSIWESDICLSWNETLEWCDLFGLTSVPVLYEGEWNEKLIKACYTGVSKYGDTQEGYVIRNAQEFKYEDFGANVAKFVRKNHVLTDKHWMTKTVVPNKCLE